MTRKLGNRAEPVDVPGPTQPRVSEDEISRLIERSKRVYREDAVKALEGIAGLSAQVTALLADEAKFYRRVRRGPRGSDRAMAASAGAIESAALALETALRESSRTQAWMFNDLAQEFYEEPFARTDGLMVEGVSRFPGAPIGWIPTGLNIAQFRIVLRFLGSIAKRRADAWGDSPPSSQGRPANKRRLEFVIRIGRILKAGGHALSTTSPQERPKIRDGVLDEATSRPGLFWAVTDALFGYSGETTPPNAVLLSRAKKALGEIKKRT